MPLLNCPSCDFSRVIEAERIKPGPMKVRCPKCQTGFEVQGETLLAEAPATIETEGAGPELELDWSGRETPAQRAAASVAPGAYDLPAVPTFQPVYAPPSNALASMVIPAPYGARVVAALIDGAVIYVVLQLLGILVGRILATRIQAISADPVAYRDQLVSLTVSLSIVGFAVHTAWYVVPTAIWGKTLGKRMMGLTVVALDGEPPGLVQVLFREVVGKFLSGLFCGVGYLLPLFDSQGRALHDRLARTVVIKD